MYDFAKTYAALDDERLLSLASERKSLLPEAQAALEAEVTKRGLQSEMGPARDEISSFEDFEDEEPRIGLSWIVNISILLLASSLLEPFFSKAFGSAFGSPHLNAILIMLGVTILVAFGVGGWYKSSANPKPAIAAILAWVSLIGWYIPLLGFFSSTMAFRLSTISKRPWLTDLIAVIGFVLSLVSLVSTLWNTQFPLT